jgi:hypothetical protein
LGVTLVDHRRYDQKNAPRIAQIRVDKQRIRSSNLWELLRSQIFGDSNSSCSLETAWAIEKPTTIEDTAGLWDSKQFKQLANLPGVKTQDFDQCTMGSVSTSQQE